MFQRLHDAVSLSKGSLATAFRRLGWTGFWLQVVFGSVPVVSMVYFFAFSRPEASLARSGVPFVQHLTILSLLVMLFTIYWSHRYTHLARRIADPHTRPPLTYVVGAVWTGLLASAVGMLFSMVIMLLEAANLLFHFLKSPQGGVPVIQTSGAATLYFVSAVDMVSLMSLIVTNCAELVTLIFSLWLLYRATIGSIEYPPASAEAAAPTPPVE